MAARGSAPSASAPARSTPTLLRTIEVSRSAEILERIPMKRIAPADEIARAVLMFFGDDASYVNGAVTTSTEATPPDAFSS